MTALQSRRVDVVEWCPICHNEPENDFHALLSCPYCSNVWCISPLGSNLDAARSLVGWWNSIVSSRSLHEVKITAVVLWSIWQNRNDVVWNGKSKTTPLIYQSAVDIISQWNSANQLPVDHRGSSLQIDITTWSKPPAGSVKCDVDVAVFSSPFRAGFGCIIRDSHGTFVAAVHGSVPGHHPPTTAEALGIREALSWLKDFQVQNVFVESDALVVIDALNSSNSDSSSFGLIVEDCKLLASELINCNFCFAKRSANQAAHILARATGSMTGSMDGCPHPPV